MKPWDRPGSSEQADRARRPADLIEALEKDGNADPRRGGDLDASEHIDGDSEPDVEPALEGDRRDVLVRRWLPGEGRWVDAMPDAERAVIDSRKFHAYSMDPSNPNNRGKHKAWEQLGHNVADDTARERLSTDVIELLKRRLSTVEVADHGPHPRGHTYEVRIMIPGAPDTDTSGTLVTIWRRELRTSAPRLITNWLEVHRHERGDQS